MILTGDNLRIGTISWPLMMTVTSLSVITSNYTDNDCQCHIYSQLINLLFIFLIILMYRRVSELTVVNEVLRKYIDPEKADAIHKQR